MRLESSRPARVEDARSGALLCAATPCVLAFTRSWPHDSSLHFRLLRAVSQDGASRQLGFDTHAPPRAPLRFDFEAAPPAP